MGIDIKHPVQALTDEAFRKLDYQVMALAFDLYNEIGNLWDENDYKEQLRERCISKGLKLQTEAMISVSHKEFNKSYFIDMLIEGAVYELKTTADIAASHESQTLNYLFLTNTQHGKIINFRPDSLQWRFVSTSLSFNQRKLYSLSTGNWMQREAADPCLPDLISELMDEWGAYLDLQLYKDAILFFIGLSTDQLNKRFYSHLPDSLIHITALSRKKNIYQKNLQKYLHASTCQYMDWINFDQNQIELHTLSKKSFCH